jgi:flagellar hook protein FlgE
MMRSLYSGVSGLQNHQIRMDVIGNNISNVNTTGFKKGRVVFQDMLSQTMSGAASPTDEIGGVNPKQVGLGMVIASIDTIHTQGSLQTTGNMTDLALQGNGFFVEKNGDKLFYTRAGNFGLDEDGYLVNPSNGMKVQGWMADEIDGEQVINVSAEIEDLIIPIGGKDPAKMTSQIDFACNLDKRTELDDSWLTTFSVFDSYGREHKLQVAFSRDAETPNRWRAEVNVDQDAEVGTNTTIPELGTNVFYLDFDNLGVLQSVQDEAGNLLQEDGDLVMDVQFDVPESDEVEGGPYTQIITMDLGTVGSAQDSITQYAEDSSTKIVRQDGYSMGYLESFKIDQNGVIIGVYSNGTNREIGQIALASFTNPGGLEKAGENTYVITNNSGEAIIGPSLTAGKGKIIAGALEMSNVDLAEQFTDMIVTQRGFQANSRTITTSDQMLQELLTLKR